MLLKLLKLEFGSSVNASLEGEGDLVGGSEAQTSKREGRKERREGGATLAEIGTDDRLLFRALFQGRWTSGESTGFSSQSRATLRASPRYGFAGKHAT